MNKFNVTVLMPSGEAMHYVRYGLTAADVSEMESRRNPSASSITIEAA